MTKVQLDNLIRFCFHFHKMMDCYWVSQSPDYIKEKWDKYIGVSPKNNNSELSYEKNLWIEQWNVNNDDYIEMKEIIDFISIINSKPIFNLTPSNIIETFEICIGEKNKINNYTYNGLHSMINSQIEVWKNTNICKRDYNINLIFN